MTELLTEGQAAALLKMSVKTLQGWRSRGDGPPYHKFGRSVRYSRAGLEAFVEQAVRRSTSDPSPHNRSPQIRTEHLLSKTGRRLETPSPNRSGTPSPPAPASIPRLRRRLHVAYIKRTPRPPRG